MSRTLNELFLDATTTHRKPDAVVQWTPGGVAGLSSGAVREAVDRLALAWRGLGLEKGDRVAILSDNCPEWLLTDYAVLAAGGVPVPIYTSLTAPQIEYILRDSEARGIMVSTRELLDRVLSIKPRLPSLEHVVVVDTVESAGPGVVTWKELMARGSELKTRDPDAFERMARAVQPEDLATIIYTSGTTGDPKGVMLSHGNFVFNIKAVQQVFNFTPEDRALSFLPLSHVFERMADYLYMMTGVTIVYVPLEDVAVALPAMRPTILVSVPRLYEKMRDKILERVAAAPSLRRKLFHWARRLGRTAYLEPILGGAPPSAWTRLKLAVADALVLSKIRGAIGGRVRRAISGGAALPRDVAEFFTTLGIFITEGYGLTETSPALTLNDPDAIRPGTVGRPINGVRLKIADDGEILAAGPGIMQGYFADPEGTAAVIQNGWFHTGDIGEIDADGSLRITDRKKDLIVTSGGKNVAPQLLEQAIISTGSVSQAVVIGNGRNFISALLVPDVQALKRACTQAGADSMPPAEAVRNSRVMDAFRKILDDAMKPFATYEQVKKFALISEEFTIESGEMTPTMKVKRRVVEQNHAALIDSFYQQPRESGS